MKALPIVITLFAATSTSYALQCQYLNIRITNNTPYTCYLTEYKLSGDVYLHHVDINDVLHTVPLSIRPGMKTKQYSVMEGVDPVTLNLRYECGEGRSITIHSTQPQCRATHGHIRGKVLAAENMSATYETTDSHFGGPQGKIRWTFN